MLKSSLIIPLPPGTTEPAHNGESKPAVGLYPCLGDDCNEYILLRLDNRGRPYGRCSARDITIKGCKRGGDGLAADIPPQTPAMYQERLSTVADAFPLKRAYREELERIWAPHMPEPEPEAAPVTIESEGAVDECSD